LSCRQNYYNLSFKLLNNTSSLKNVLDEPSSIVTENRINYSNKIKKSNLDKRFGRQEIKIFATKVYDIYVTIRMY